MSFNPNYVQTTLHEAAEFAATTITERFALTTLAKNGVVSIEETENVYDIAYRLLTEGSEDMIPETLELPDAQDASVGADVAAAGGDEDLDISELEGIVLPDSEGNQYIIQGGILVPYGDDQDQDDGGGDDPQPADDGDGDVDPAGKPDATDATDATDDDLEEGTKPVEGTSITEGTEIGGAGTEEGQTELTENTIFSSTSEFVKNLVNAKIK